MILQLVNTRWQVSSISHAIIKYHYVLVHYMVGAIVPF